jgi:5-(carboxyamino)imidazole ribonucleotide synthase
MIPPGSTIGILGGGQLGRMLAIAAANMGYRTHIYAPGISGPACEVAARWTRGLYEDAAAVARFAGQVDVITYEFENVEVGSLLRVPGVYPNPRALEVAQDRAIEKGFAADQGGRTAPWRMIDSLSDLNRALTELGTPAVLKARRFGYDGKGQVRITDNARAESAWIAIGEAPAILEAHVHFTSEFSILIARGIEGQIERYDAIANQHRDGILRKSSVPVEDVAEEQIQQATLLAVRLADTLDYVGVLACEFFATPAGPVFNEMAPRVHNSGHWTIEGAVTSQFENHIRAICGLSLGSARLVGTRAEMRNLIGEEAESWERILADPTARLHLYGKSTILPGRKMGHVTWVG